MTPAEQEASSLALAYQLQQAEHTAFMQAVRVSSPAPSAGGGPGGPQGMDTDEESLEKRALRFVEKGEQVCVDYNYCAGYDVRTDESMRRFLALCEEFGVVKRPSSFS